MARPLPLDDIMALKSATLDLVKAVGGLETAEEICGVSKSQIQRWYAALDDKGEVSHASIPAAAIACLEGRLADLGDPRRPVTRCLARHGGLELTEGGEARERAEKVSGAAIAFAGIAHRAVEELMTAISDGLVTPGEASGCDRTMGEVDAALARLRATLVAAMSSKGDRT